MHCPNCGAEAPLTQKYCRSCGFNLEKVPELVAEQLSTLEVLHETDKLERRKRKIDQSLLVAGIGFVSVIVISMVTGIIYLVAAGNMPLLPGIILLIMILTGIIAGSLATYSERLKKTLSNPVRPTPLPLVDSPASLDAQQGQFVSVTERTTNLLETNLEKRENHSTQERSE